MNVIKRYLPILIVVLVAIPTIIPLFESGFFSMHDDTQVSRIYLMWKALSDGQFPVRWVQDLGYGYGYPIFNFYAPLPYYIGAFFMAVTQDALLATKIVFACALLGSAGTMYYFARQYLGEIGGVVAGMIYAYFPYHAVNTYVRGNLSELYAYIFLPVYFLAIYRLYYAQEKHVKNNIFSVLLLAVSFSFIVISHNLSAYMTALLSGGLIVIGTIFTKNKRSFALSVIAGMLLAVLVSAFYWVPVLFESKFTDVNSQLGGGSDVLDHFVCLNQFWNSPWGYTGSVQGCIDGMSFRMGKTNIIFAAISVAIIGYAFYKKKIKHLFFSWSVLVLATFSFLLMTEASSLLWRFIPGMEYLQFPWRFMNYFALFISLLIGSCVAIMYRFHKITGIISGIFIVTATMYVNTKLFAPEKNIPNTAQHYTNFSTIAFEVSKRSDEYLPQNFPVPQSLEEVPKQVIESPQDVKIVELINVSHKYQVKLEATRASTIHFNRAFFPSWVVTVDGKETKFTSISKGFDISIPPGSHVVSAEIVSTPVQKIANALSLVGIGVLIVGIILGKSYDNRKHAS